LVVLVWAAGGVFLGVGLEGGGGSLLKGVGKFSLWLPERGGGNARTCQLGLRACHARPKKVVQALYGLTFADKKKKEVYIR